MFDYGSKINGTHLQYNQLENTTINKATTKNIRWRWVAALCIALWTCHVASAQTLNTDKGPTEQTFHSGEIPVPADTSHVKLFDGIDTILVHVQTPLDIDNLRSTASEGTAWLDEKLLEKIISEKLTTALTGRKAIQVKPFSVSSPEDSQNPAVLKVILGFQRAEMSGHALVLGAMTPFILRAPSSDNRNSAPTDMKAPPIGLLTSVPFIWQIDGDAQDASMKKASDKVVTQIIEKIPRSIK